MTPMLPISIRHYPVLALLISGGLLIGAWIFQYGLGYAPCQMCYWQRDAHKVVIVLAVIGIIANKLGRGSPRLWAILISLALAGSFGVAMWHVGVEYGWWEGPKTCMAGSTDITQIDPTKLLDSLNDPFKMPACSEAAWRFLGLSMAGWNALVSLLAAITAFLARKESADV